MADYYKQRKGFSVTEIAVVLAIILMLVSIVMVNFSRLKNQIAMNLAVRGMGLSIRQAQAYAIAVREFNSSFAASICQAGVSPPARFPPYGVSITKINLADSRDSATYILFGDIACASRIPTPPIYNPSYAPSEIVTSTTMQQGVTVTSIVGHGGTDVALDTVDIVYQRPSPAVILVGYVGAANAMYPWVDVTLTTKDGKESKVISVRTSGQISIQ